MALFTGFYSVSIIAWACLQTKLGGEFAPFSCSPPPRTVHEYFERLWLAFCLLLLALAAAVPVMLWVFEQSPKVVKRGFDRALGILFVVGGAYMIVTLAIANSEWHTIAPSSQYRESSVTSTFDDYY